MTRSLLLASTSPHRRTLLARLGIPFASVAPGCDEDSFHGRGLPPRQLAASLAEAKARSVAAAHPEALVIGSDQVCALDLEVHGKPGGRDAAIVQLRRLRGRAHHLHTAVCVLDRGETHAFVDDSRLTMRALTDDEIARYVDADRPFDCAGAYKLESLGIALFATIDSGDHTAIVGLPMLRLCDVLRSCGVPLP
ncbi:MAG: Maf family protein [Planctomycetota bacterium]